MLEGIPDAWGPKFQIGHCAVTNTQTGPNAIRMKAEAHCVLVLMTTQVRRHVALNSDRTIVGTAPAGSLEIVPHGADLFAQWDEPKENIFAALGDDRLRRLAGSEFGNEDFEWHSPRLGQVDAQALLVARNIRQELQAGECATHACVDAWITVLGIHLLRRYSSLSAVPAQSGRGGLSMRAWRRVEDFIRANMAEKLTVEHLAAVAQLSPSHFARAFRETSGRAPHQYLLALRIEKARQLILENAGSFEEIAQLCGFASNSHMSFSFRRNLGVTPKQMRRGGD